LEKVHHKISQCSGQAGQAFHVREQTAEWSAAGAEPLWKSPSLPDWKDQPSKKKVHALFRENAFGRIIN